MFNDISSLGLFHNNDPSIRRRLATDDLVTMKWMSPCLHNLLCIKQSRAPQQCFLNMQKISSATKLSHSKNMR